MMGFETGPLSFGLLLGFAQIVWLWQSAVISSSSPEMRWKLHEYKHAPALQLQ